MLPMVTGEDTATQFTRNGYTILREPFPADLHAALIADAEQRIFTPPHPRAGGAFAMAPLESSGATGLTARWLIDSLLGVGLRILAPNEASYQRYQPGGNGLPPHRDQRYYASCIAIITLQGAATSAIHASRMHGDVTAEWNTHPGQVILLQGWQPQGPDDPRPYHRVDPPADAPRLIFQLRHNLAASVPPSSLLSTLTATEIEQAIGLAAAIPRA
jgi:hypothetical protein